MANIEKNAPGASIQAAKKQLALTGPNELPSAKPKNVLGIAKEVMKEPMFSLLLGAGSLYMFLGDHREGAVLLSTIFLIISITFFQYRKTEKALQALRSLSSPRAIVIRDGMEMRIPGREVVPGDLLIINEGDRIPADAEVLETTNFQVDESLLTGESMPVPKYVESAHNALYGGTLAVQGRCIAKVTGTGLRSRLGKIAASLEAVGDSTTRMQQEMKVLVRRFGIIGLCISVGVIVAFYLTRGDLLRSVLLGLASSMAILPEEFPVIMTVFLALGAWRLSKKNVLTRKPSAIETLGSATVLCSDKTGTITQNKMGVAAVCTSEGHYPHIDPQNSQLVHVIKVAQMASEPETIDPMDKAIVELAASMSILPRDTPVREFPLSHELLAVTRVYRGDTGGFVSAAKGAPEAIFKLCDLAAAEVKKYEEELEKMAAAGYRVLGVAESSAGLDALPQDRTVIRMRFVGLLAFEDPIRPEVPQAISDCHLAGIKVMMITGDHPLTARTVAKNAGLQADAVVTGEELSLMTDEQLRARVKEDGIFARIAPEHKLRIVKALKDNGEVVAMTGDGVNDAPALKAADIGIAMGRKGTDVAREASSLVLLDDNFASIVSGIRLGRRIYDNMQKAMSYVLAIHIPIIGLTLLPAFVPSLPLLLLPLHIVFMELINDPVCSIAFESEQEEKDIMSRPPRAVDKKFFDGRRMAYSLFKGTLLLAIVLVVYFMAIKEGHKENEVRAIAFSALTVGNIFLILTDISQTRSFLSVFAERNFAAILMLLIAATLLLAILSIPGLLHLFNFDYPGLRHFIVSLLGATLLLAVLEAIKYARRKRS